MDTVTEYKKFDLLA